jgi:ABC-type transport system substrate-binding protein
VIVLRRSAAGSAFLIVAITLAILLAGCGPATSTQAPVGSPGRSAGLSPVPGRLPTPVVGATIGPPTTTDTEFGRIFDALPPSFPKLLGQEPAETGAGPTSGSFAANMSVGDARKIMEVSLIAQGWTVEVGSPLEDGTIVLEATSTKVGCKTEVRFTPRSGTVIMSVLYGASCPFS